MLEGLGARVDVAGNGREAVDMLRLMRYDLVLMDCEMPVMTGHQAVAELRSREGAAQHVRVVSMKTSHESPCRNVCTDCGMDDILCKPVRMQDLLEVRKRWVPQASAPVTAGNGIPISG
jgi:CheY-like chemotaxis protein